MSGVNDDLEGTQSSVERFTHELSTNLRFVQESGDKREIYPHNCHFSGDAETNNKHHRPAPWLLISILIDFGDATSVVKFRTVEISVKLL